MNLLGLGYLFVNQVPMFMEFLLGYYIPMIVASIFCLLIFVTKIQNKIFLAITIIICLVGPGFLLFEFSNRAPTLNVNGVDMPIPDEYR